jgi:NAD(P)-dependent dehydrogenase (short-subunit alcohol dehydrogenase family)
VKNTVLGGVVITGASTGIGEACAFHLDALGFRVFAGVRDPADGERLTRAASDRVVPVQLDVTDAGSVRSAAETVAHLLADAPLKGLVNNSGIAVASPLEFVPLDALRRQMEVNVIGQVAVTQAFLAPLRRARGRIVNMGSMAGRFASPFMGPYSASKFALEALTDSLRLEAAPLGHSRQHRGTRCDCHPDLAKVAAGRRGAHRGDAGRGAYSVRASHRLDPTWR